MWKAFAVLYGLIFVFVLSLAFVTLPPEIAVQLSSADRALFYAGLAVEFAAMIGIFAYAFDLRVPPLVILAAIQLGSRLLVSLHVAGRCLGSRHAHYQPPARRRRPAVSLFRFAVPASSQLFRLAGRLALWPPHSAATGLHGLAAARRPLGLATTCPAERWTRRPSPPKLPPTQIQDDSRCGRHLQFSTCSASPSAWS